MAPYDSYDYLQYWDNRSFEDKCERICLSAFANKIKNRESIIDIGGGFGRLSSFYSPLFKKCVVMEPSIKNIRQGEELFKDLANVSFKQGSLPKLDVKDNSFAVAMMIRVSHHLPNLAPSINEVYRILKPEGYFIFEIANKVHILARIRALLAGQYSKLMNFEPLERRSSQNIEEKTIAFSNHHPEKVLQDLKKSGFSIVEIRSVSNLRSPFLKSIFPEQLLCSLEKMMQTSLARFFFGPSIFVLAQKN